MKWNIATVPLVIKRVIRAYYEQIYIHKFNNLVEMDQFLKNSQTTKSQPR